MTRSQRFVHGLSKALWDSDLVATRVSLALAEFLWAIMLLWVGDTFSRPTYHIMSLVMSEEAWGLLLLLSAVTQITVVMSETYHTIGAIMFAAWNAALWIFLCLSMLLSVNPPPAAIGGQLALTFAASWVWLRPYILSELWRRANEST